MEYIIFVIVVGLAFVLNLFNIRICPFFNLFHIPCPGCGFTRATILLLQGKIFESLKYNLLVIPFIIAFIFYTVVILTGKKKFLCAFLNKYKTYIIVLSIIVTSIVWIINIQNKLLY